MDKIKIEDYATMWMHAAYAYYEHGQTVMPDAQFDAMAKDFLENYSLCPIWFHRLISKEDLKAGTAFHLRGKWPKWVIDGYDGARVRTATPFAPIKHISPMYSLSNGFESADVNEFLMQTHHRDPPIYADVKADGVAGNLVYRDGILTSGATRGDGEIGEDITHALEHIVGVPRQLSGDGFEGVVEIRGEFVMRHDDFKRYNDWTIKNGGKALANPRNGVAGSLRQKDMEEVKRRRVTFYAHGAVFKHDFALHSQMMGKVKSWGFSCVPKIPASALKRVEDGFVFTGPNARQLIAKSVPFLIDGVVLKLDSIPTQTLLGFRSRTPRWALAYKFPAEEAQATIELIFLQVGRTGVVTPVAMISPTEVGGVIVTRATLHNESHIREFDFRVGDRVMVRRAGDVVPEIFANVSRDEDHRQTHSSWEMPKKCPSCQAELTNDGGKKIYCRNVTCLGQLLAKCVHLVSRDAHDIVGLAEETLAKLIEAEHVKAPSDILYLTQGVLSLMMGDVNGPKIHKAIQTSSGAIELRKFLYALGIPQVGQSTSRDLANAFGSLEAIQKATVEQLKGIDGIEQTTADLIRGFFDNPASQQEVERRTKGCIIVNPVVRQNRPLLGMNYVITGSFGDLTRSEMTDVLTSMGARVASSVSKNTTLVMAGDEAGTKLTKAQSLGITVLNKQESINAIREMQQ